MLKVLWIVLTTVLGGLIGHHFFAEPWIGSGIGFLVGGIILLMTRVGSEVGLNILDTLGDIFSAID